MLEIRDIKVSIDCGDIFAELKKLTAKKLGIKPENIVRIKLLKKAVDARKKREICYICSVMAELSCDEGRFLKYGGVSEYEEYSYTVPYVGGNGKRPVIVGFGPGGMFAALILAKAGMRPIVIERGENAEERTKKVKEFWDTGKLDIRTNVQFGEGGAGTFSDGKLNTGTHNSRINCVLSEFVRFGAPENILWDSKPHIGTDILVKVVVNLRHEIEKLGGEVRFSQKLIGIDKKDGKIESVTVEKAEGMAYGIETDILVLAIGHSARDTFEMLEKSGFALEPKPFSMGVRIEHRQKDISFAQYGEVYKKLPAADYKLSVKLPDGNSAYTFCMCPGGYVAAAASEEGGVVTNGMSYSARDGENANSAVLVSLTPEDFPYEGALGGMKWQREIEEKAFEIGGRNYKAPAMYLGDFLGTGSPDEKDVVKPTYRPGVSFTDISGCLPEKICSVLKQAIPQFARKIRGFDSPGAVMTAPETRSSSPVRITRNEERQTSVKGIYPVGEGAGYAGGITSSAVDGILTAEAIIGECLNNDATIS